METHSECKVKMTRATYVHWWNWMEGLGCLSTQQDLSVPLELISGGIFTQLHGSCQCLTYIVRGNCRKNTPGQKLLLILPGLPLQRPLGRLCFLPGSLSLISARVFSPPWSADHIYEPASEPAHPANILVELLADYKPAIIEGLGCSLILCSPILPWSECLLL